MIDLRCADVSTMMRDVLLSGERADLIMADPPWDYQNWSDTKNGAAGAYYDGLPEWDIAQHIATSGTIAANNAYLAVWCTLPKLEAWLYNSRPILASVGWTYITGGAWVKTGGRGIGFHFAGDVEPLLLYRKGSVKPQGGPQSNVWPAERQGHSEKPQKALRAIVGSFCPPGGLVVELYAGASASGARACRAMGRRYIGAEIDPARHAMAMMRLSQQEMFNSLEATA